MAIKEQIILEGVDKTKAAFSSVQKNLQNIDRNTSTTSKGFSRLQTAIVAAVGALGTFKLAKGFLDTAVQLENLEVQLKFLTGSAKEGAAAFETLNEFAGKVPFELRDIANAAPNLLTVVDGTDELNEVLALTGDIAAATGLDFKTTAEQIQRAFSGGIAAADIFREKGIKSLLGFQEGTRYTAEQTKEIITAAFRDGTTTIKGASGDMAQTLTGVLSQLSDKTLRFQKALMDAGPFNFIKSLVKSLDDYLQSKFGSIEQAGAQMGQKLVDAFQAATIGLAKFGDMITPLVKMAANAIKGLFDMVNSLPGVIKSVGVIGFLLLGIKGKLLVLTIAASFNKIKLLFADLMDYFVKGKETLAKLVDKLGMDEYAESLRQNAKEIAESNEKIRKSVEEAGKSIIGDNEEIVLSMGDFGEVTAEEFEKAGPLVQALTEYYKQLNEETAKTAAIQEGLSYVDPIMVLGERKAEEIAKEQAANVELQKQLEKINQKIYNNKLYFKKLETEAIEAFNQEQIKEAEKMAMRKKYFQEIVTKAEEKEAKKQLFIQTQLNKRKLDFQQKVAEAEKQFRENQTTALKSYTDGFISEMERQSNVMEQLSDAGQRAFGYMTDAITTFAMTGKFNFKQFANSVIQDLVRIAAKQAIVFALKKAASFFLPFPIPFFADGGNIGKNQPGIVGEKGPELFVPNQSGTIIPNDQLGRSGGMDSKEVTINFTVNAIDSASFADAMGEQRDLIVNIVNEAVTNDGRRAIA
jgi:hypothetical protein